MIFIFKTNVKQHQSISPLVCLQFRVFRLLGLKKVLIAVCTRFLVHLDKNEISHVLFLLFLLICSTLNKARSQRQRLTGRLRPSVTCERFPTQSWSRSGVREGGVWRGGGGGGGVSLESHARDSRLTGNWQRSRLILCCLCSPQHAPVCVSPCPLVCQCCHVSGSCAAGSGEAELDPATHSETRQNKDTQQVCLETVSASILRRENSEAQTFPAVVEDWHEQTWKWVSWSDTAELGVVCFRQPGSFYRPLRTQLQLCCGH